MIGSSLSSSWEGREFTQDECITMLEAVAKKKPDDILMVDHGMIKKAGMVTKIWQTIRGWVGFENKTNPVCINYQILKLMRYGDIHGYFDSYEVRDLVSLLKKNLSKDSHHSEVVGLINNFNIRSDKREEIAAIETAINAYYAVHDNELRDPFWTHLFHRTVEPMQANTAFNRFTEGCMHAKDSDYAKAVAAMKEAVAQQSDQANWQWTLAVTQDEYAQMLLAEGKDLEAFNQYKELVALVEDMARDPLRGPIFDDFAHKIFMDIVALSVKLGDLGEALKHRRENLYLQTIGRYNFDSEYPALINSNPKLKAADANVEEFYQALEKNPPVPLSVFYSNLSYNR